MELSDAPLLSTRYCMLPTSVELIVIDCQFLCGRFLLKAGNLSFLGIENLTSSVEDLSIYE